MLKPVSKTGEELIFYNYKEPLKEVVGGYGYMGVILSNKEGTKIMCHICGSLFGELQAHVRQAHDMSTRDYKEKYGLAFKTALVSEEIRTQRKIRTMQWWNELTADEKINFRKKATKALQEYQKNNPERMAAQPLLTLETKNKRGTCPDQLLWKIKKVARELGHSPSKDEFIDYWGSQKFIHIIYKTFGSWKKAKKMAGFDKTPFNQKGIAHRRHSTEELIEYLQIFYKDNNKVPTETDFRRGLLPDSQIYKTRFGSIPLAREAAGIHEEVGRWVKKDMVK